MRFDDFDKKMRLYEESLDQKILPDIYIVARLDGRSFTKLTKETIKYEAPFDINFLDLMVNTTKSLMTDSGFRILYGYTQSDEISLLFAADEDTFGRKVRKINTTLAGEASAAVSLQLGMKATMDCRVVPLPNADRVVDYFVWRQEDATRNALNSWCYWTLRKEGYSVGKATSELKGKGVSFKNELLFQRGINFNDLPDWQKRGVGVYPKDVEKEGYNPITKEKVVTTRKQLFVDQYLYYGDDYRKFIAGFIG
ncbi:MAG: hypothetical protein IJI14_05930 [Anaerolineaceae bacterium]|nr:hypothetical protein [Anaerolineaceae bacterium]